MNKKLNYKQIKFDVKMARKEYFKFQDIRYKKDKNSIQEKKELIKNMDKSFFNSLINISPNSSINLEKYRSDRKTEPYEEQNDDIDSSKIINGMMLDYEVFLVKKFHKSEKFKNNYLSSNMLKRKIRNLYSTMNNNELLSLSANTICLSSIVDINEYFHEYELNINNILLDHRFIIYDLYKLAKLANNILIFIDGKVQREKIFDLCKIQKNILTIYKNLTEYELHDIIDKDKKNYNLYYNLLHFDEISDFLDEYNDNSKQVMRKYHK